MRIILTLLALSLTLLQTACSDSVNEDLQGSPTGQFEAEFDPGKQVIPFPSNLLFSGTKDGTLNIPLSGGSSDGPRIAMNALDGFSTVAPITSSFAKAIDPASINGTTVRLWEVNSDPATKAVIGFVAALTFGVDYFATPSSTDTTDRTLAILPLKPLKPASTYLVILTKGLKSNDGQTAHSSQTYLSARIAEPVVDANGNSRFPSFTNEQAQALEPLRKLTNAQDAVMKAVEADLPDKVVLAWAFSTQSVGPVLQSVRGLAAVGVSSAINPTSIGTTKTLNPSLSGKADIYLGSITLPYYLGAPGTATDTTPLTRHWEAATTVAGETHLTGLNPLPAKTTDVTIPVLVAIPNATSLPGGAKPGAGWQTAIFQHGITRNRSDMLALADALADGNIATVAIDLPLHGLGSASVGLYVQPNLGNPTNISGERTFDVDYVTQDPTTGSITSPVPDGTSDSSGRHFVNLSSLLTSRDNIRQAVADLMGLTAEIPTMDYDGGGADFNSNGIFFIGHSLGGIVGSVFLANEANVQQSVLASPGGGIAKLLDGSVSIGPEITAGLAAAAGLTKGTSEYEAFFGAAQTVLDAADPINYAAATASGRGLMMFEVIGDGALNLPDQVVPNHVGTLAKVFKDAPVGTAPAPLSGTDPLSSQMVLTRVSGASASAGAVGGGTPWLRFTGGDHGSILNPTASLLVTQTMQTAAVGFLAGGGLGFDISAIANVGTVLE